MKFMLFWSPSVLWRSAALYRAAVNCFHCFLALQCLASTVVFICVVCTLFFICLFLSSSVFWCNVSVYCVFTGVVCFVNVFTFDLLPLTCSVVSYCLLEMIYNIQYFVCILSNGHPVCAVYVCVRVCVIVCARWSQQKVFQISQNLCGTFVVHVGGK